MVFIFSGRIDRRLVQAKKRQKKNKQSGTRATHTQGRTRFGWFFHLFFFYLQAPIEAADLDGFLIEMNLQGVLVNDVDDGTHHRGGVARDPVQQRLQPAFVGWFLLGCISFFSLVGSRLSLIVSFRTLFRWTRVFFVCFFLATLFYHDTHC